MRILITDDTHPILQQKLEAAGHEVTIDSSLTYQLLLACVEQYDAIVVRSKISIDRNFIDHARHLICIGRVGAGMETIDVAYAEGQGIRCLNSPEGNRDAVGEHTIGLLLALMDKIAKADKEVRQGLWQRELNRGTEIQGKTVGIIGFGNMGGSFAQRLQGFDCRVIAYDLLGRTASGFGRQPWVESVSIEQLQQEADIVSLHVPLTEETHYLVNGAFLRHFSKPIYLINTSRGAVVNTDHLAKAMTDGQVIGAGLDVMEYEEMAKDGIGDCNRTAALQYLWDSDRTVLTPHVAGWTVESKKRLAETLADKIIETC